MRSTFSTLQTVSFKPGVELVMEAFDGYCNDAKIADLHPGACDYIWHLFDKLEDLRPILK